MVYSGEFVFDLQRFATWTLTYESSKFKLTNGTTEYTGSAGTIIGNAATGKASDEATESNTTPMLAADDTIQLGDNIEYSDGPLVFNAGIALTLDLNGKTLKSTSGDGIAVGYGTIINGTGYSFYQGAKKGNNLTIIGSGNIESSATDTNAIRLYGPEHEYPDLDPSEYSQLTVGRQGKSDEINIQGVKRGISGLGGANYFNVEINTTGTIQGTSHGIYNSQVGNLTINNGTIKATDGTAVEFRAGVLTVNGENTKIESTGTATEVKVQKNSGSKPFASKGAGIAIVQHDTAKDITVNINDGDISGYVALATANSQSNGKFGQSTVGLSPGSPAFYGRIKLDDNGNPLTRTYNGKQVYIATNAKGEALDYYYSSYKNDGTTYHHGSILYVTYENDTPTYYVSERGYERKEGSQSNSTLGTAEFEDVTDSISYELKNSVDATATKANPVYQRVTGTITVNVNGGKLKSTSTATTENATKTGDTYTITGRNAIVNLDDRVTVNLTNAEVDGNLAASQRTTTGENPNAASFNILSGNKFSAFEDGITNDDIFVARNVGESFVAEIMGAKGWNPTTQNSFVYHPDAEGTTTTATLAPAITGSGTATVLSATDLKLTTSAAIAIDLTKSPFSGGLSSTFTTFDASAAEVDVFVTGNDKITSISGGAGNDSIFSKGEDVTIAGGKGADVFFFDGNKNTITDFGTGNDSVTLANSKFRPANADFMAATDGKITIDFGGGDALMFENLDDKTEVSLPGGHVFATGYHAFDKQITFTSVQSADYDASAKDYATIDAAEAGAAIKITGNALDNRIIGSNKGGSLNGGEGNDRLIVTDREADVKYLFEYKAGKDSIEGFDDANDTLNVDATKITEAEGNGSKLTLTFADKDSGVILKSDVDIEKVSLNASGDYLTSSGYFADTSKEFKLFANAKGKIDLTDTPYKDTGIKTIDATDAKKQSVTLTADSNVTTVKLAENKKKDLFNFGGGTVSITGYEAGTDKLNIADVGAVSLFTVDSTGVSINAGGKGIISIQGALKNQEVLIRDGGKNNSYQKFVFHDNGVLYNKAKKPTQADIYSNVSTSSTIKVDDSIKKIFLQTGVSGAKIESGNNKATLDASEADGVTLIGGAKNNKFIASTGADMFVYKGGKDVIKDFDAKDEISFNATDFNLNTAKISASGKSLKFKFTNKNVLTLKSDSKITSASINGGDYSFSKNAVGLNGVVSLTSQFSGSYNLEKSTARGNIVYGGDVRKNITFKGTNAAESLVGGQKKTNFKGGGGDDTFVGGDGKDIFFYAKTDSGNKTIENFGFGSNNDKIKIASGTIKTISKSGDDIIFSTNGGSLTLTKDAEDTKDVLIKANNTYYWFADSTTAGKTDGVSVGDLITADTRVSNAQATAAVESGYEILDLSYTTNLVKTNLATKAGEFEFTSTSGISKNDT